MKTRASALSTHSHQSIPYYNPTPAITPHTYLIKHYNYKNEKKENKKKK